MKDLYDFSAAVAAVDPNCNIAIFLLIFRFMARAGPIYHPLSGIIHVHALNRVDVPSSAQILLSF